MTTPALRTDAALTYQQRSRILKGVILGSPLPHDAGPAAVAWRQRCERDVAKCRANGLMPELPFDPTYGDEDAAPPPMPTGTELATEVITAYPTRSASWDEQRDRVRAVAEGVAEEQELERRVRRAGGQPALPTKVRETELDRRLRRIHAG